MVTEQASVSISRNKTTFDDWCYPAAVERKVLEPAQAYQLYTQADAEKGDAYTDTIQLIKLHKI